MQTWSDDLVRMAHWAKLRSFAQALTEMYKALGQAPSLKPPEPPLRGTRSIMHSHSEYLEKLRKGVKGNMALFAFDVQAKARRAKEEAQQLMEVGGVVTCVEDVADLENVAYWQQGRAMRHSRLRREWQSGRRSDTTLACSERSRCTGKQPSAACTRGEICLPTSCTRRVMP